MEYLKIKNSIVISDLHIGIEMEFSLKGVFIPWQVENLKKKIERILEREKNIQRIIINGDLKHNILRVSYKEIKNVLEFLNFVEELFDEVIIVKGNHDGKIEKLLGSRNIFSHFLERKTLIMHGHKRLPKDINVERVIIGHVHPIFKFGSSTEKVFLRGFIGNLEIIVLPAFSDLCGGRDPREKLKGPIAKMMKDIQVISLEGDLVAIL